MLNISLPPPGMLVLRVDFVRIQPNKAVRGAIHLGPPIMGILSAFYFFRPVVLTIALEPFDAGGDVVSRLNHLDGIVESRRSNRLVHSEHCATDTDVV